MKSISGAIAKLMPIIETQFAYFISVLASKQSHKGAPVKDPYFPYLMDE